MTIMMKAILSTDLGIMATHLGDGQLLHFLAAWGLATIYAEILRNAESNLALNLSQKWRHRKSNMNDTISWDSEDLQPNAKSIGGDTPLYNPARFGHKEIASASHDGMVTLRRGARHWRSRVAVNRDQALLE